MSWVCDEQWKSSYLSRSIPQFISFGGKIYPQHPEAGHVKLRQSNYVGTGLTEQLEIDYETQELMFMGPVSLPYVTILMRKSNTALIELWCCNMKAISEKKKTDLIELLRPFSFFRKRKGFQ